MPSGAYGRGGGNFTKKPKTPALSDASAKSSSLKSNEKVSLLRKMVHAMPGSQPKKSGTSASPPSRDVPTRHTIPRQTRGSNVPAHPKTNSSRPLPTPGIPFPARSSQPTMDTSHRKGAPAVNLHTITPSSSEDESGDSGDSVRALSPNDILPFTARHTSTDNEGTAVNEAPLSAPEGPRTSKAPLTAAGHRVRSVSTNDSFRRRTVSSQPQPKREDLKQNGIQKALAALEGNLVSSTGEGKPKHRPVIGDNNYKKGRRITLTEPFIPRITPARRPVSELSSFTDLLPSNLNERTHRWSESIISGPVPPSDPFNHLFTSCVISLILLIILAAGKDILYVVALLPVLMTLAKHFLDLNQLGICTPLMRKNLESLLSI